MVSETADCPTFIDLRAFASNDAVAALPDPAGFGRKALPLRGGPIAISSLHFSPGSGAAPGQQGDCFVIVASGSIAITAHDTTLLLEEGQSMVLAGGAGFEWSVLVPTTLIAMRYTAATTADARVVPIAADVGLNPSGAPLAELLIGPTPSCRNHTTFLSGDGEFMAGVWDSTPYHRRAMPYRHFELMYLLRGSVTFVDELGREGTFGAGDIFLVEQHAQCSWESREDVAKIYAIYRPVA
jgi:uncharacterized cupin superfamily protein